jgi:hypothetical protein
LIQYPSDGLGNSPYCGVLAVAIVAHRSVAEVFDIMKNAYGKRGNWKGRTQDFQVIETATKLGIKLYCVRPRTQNKGTQFMKWVNTEAALGKTYMVWTTGHVQIVANGKVYDQSGCGTPIIEHWGRRKFIQRIELVVE